jgi:Rap1a immunity proteins
MTANTLRRSLLALATIALIAPARASITGNQLYNFCRDNNADFDDGTCFGFVSGLFEVADELHLVCVPMTATPRQIRDVVLRFLERHPDNRHESARGLVLAAIQTAYPCPEGAP